jgi:GNAT superfamily N-acetyltransferase
MLVSSFTRALRETASTDNQQRLCAVKVDGNVVGMLQYLIVTVEVKGEEKKIAWLYYIALAEDYRNLGYGHDTYRWLVKAAHENGCAAIFFEVEKPDIAPDRDIANRRLNWYRRNGAKKLDGVRYMQSVGWQLPIEMDICVHGIKHIDASSAYEIAKGLVGESLEQVGHIALR